LTKRWAEWALYEADLLDPITGGGFSVPESFDGPEVQPPGLQKSSALPG
jgi:hypothetical protein